MTSTRGTPAPSRWRRDERALWRSGPGTSIVVLGAHDQIPKSLHGTAAMVWAAFATPRSAQELAAYLALEFDADEDVVRRDVEDLVLAGLLRELP